MASYPFERKAAYRIILFSILFMFALVIYLTSIPYVYEKYEPTQIDAFLVAKEFVTQKLKAPSTAKFPSSNHAKILNTGYNKWQITSYVDAQNSFGAMIRNNFTVSVSYDTNTKKWLLEKISIK